MEKAFNDLLMLPPPRSEVETLFINQPLFELLKD
jgi:hypothetical protein